MSKDLDDEFKEARAYFEALDYGYERINVKIVTCTCDLSLETLCKEFKMDAFQRWKPCTDGISVHDTSRIFLDKAYEASLREMYPMPKAYWLKKKPSWLERLLQKLR